ncbi:hypothetical protein E2562_016251 [Oryza meyeriana var. granulata]|uniref:DUF3475 domain-containing protein n=1 Tax=Oryza meyeriana var. granulata TaxID=110450 RepID=A0A6G1CQL8_9ORYZ|nr:hypothetical protein E2562_016251 [Oryza meyeriana var. granulata]
MAHQALGDAAIARLRHHLINLNGVGKVISEDDAILLGLTCFGDAFAELWARLRGAVAAADPGLAGQWRAALGGILEWLEEFDQRVGGSCGCVPTANCEYV